VEIEAIKSISSRLCKFLDKTANQNSLLLV